MIVLNMIVKNESHVIKRCLESVIPFIDMAVIVDTGSTDGTQKIIIDELAQLVDLEIHERPWVNFAVNRTEAFQLAQSGMDKGSYVLLMDADEVLRPDPSFELKGRRFTHSVVGIWNTTPKGGRYLRPQLLSAAQDFYWQGAVHEELLCEQKISGVRLDGVTCHGYFDSKRNLDPSKYVKDAVILSQEPPTARNLFYLAQSFRDAGIYDMAKVTYRRRIVLGGNPEEVWYSMYMVACMMEAQGKYSTEDIRQAYNKAYLFRQSRAEPLRALAEFNKRIGDETQHRIVHEVADMIPYPKDDQLFIEPDAYRTRFPQANVAPSQRD